MFARVARFLDGDVVAQPRDDAGRGSGSGTKCAGRTACSPSAPLGVRGLLSGAGSVANLASNHSYDRSYRAGADGCRSPRGTAVEHWTSRRDRRPEGRIGARRRRRVRAEPRSTRRTHLPAARELVRTAAIGRTSWSSRCMRSAGHGRRARASRRRDLRGRESQRRRRLLAAVVDAGADTVIGHGPHVRGRWWYRGRLIAYSLGNFAAYRNLVTYGAGGISSVLRVTLRSDGRWVRATSCRSGSWATGRRFPTGKKQHSASATAVER